MFRSLYRVLTILLSPLIYRLEWGFLVDRPDQAAHNWQSSWTRYSLGHLAWLHRVGGTKDHQPLYASSLSAQIDPRNDACMRLILIGARRLLLLGLCQWAFLN